MTPFPRAEVFLNWLLQQTLNVSVLVVVVLLIQWLFKQRLTARWRFALWWVVLFGLLLPVRPPSSFSLYNHVHADVFLQGPRYSVPANSSPVVPETILRSPMENGGELADIPVVATVENKTQATEPVLVQPTVKPLGAGPPRSFWSRYLGIPGREVGWDEIAIPSYVAVWLLGVVIFSLYVGRMVFRFRRQLAGHCLPASTEVQSAFDECQRSMQVSRRVELWETEAVKSPALYGLFRLQLLLPRGLAATFSEAELRHIFLHELAHVKRGDMWLNWLVTSLQIFHWFNPFVWLAFARLRADRELACDELALIHSGETHGQSYGQTILKLLENINQTKPMPGLVGIVEDRKQMTQRLRTIAAFRLPTKWSRLAVLLVLGLALIGLTGAQTPVTPKSNEEQTSAPGKKPVATNEEQQSAVKTDKTTNPPAQILKGRVLLPDGTPAVGAQVGFITPKSFLWINKNQFQAFGPSKVSVTDGVGEFDASQIDECLAVAALHEKGFVQVSIDDFKKSPILKLQSLGRVEGVLRIGDNLGAQQQLGLMSLNLSRQNPEPQLSPIVFKVKTDDLGKFVFDSVPPGEFTVWRTFQASPTNLWPHTVYDGSCLGRVIVAPGKTATVALGGDGIKITGRASLQGQPWDWCNTLLSANLSINPFKSANSDLIESEKTRYAYMQSEEFKALMRAQRYYTLVVKEDGTIEAPDVPPGTYQLRLEARQNLAPPGERYSMAKLKLLASLKKEVVIPESANGKLAVFDLGELVLEREAAQAPAAKPDEKQAAALEKQSSVIGDVPRLTVEAKADITTNAPHQILRGKVLDAVTRQPVTNFTVRKMEMTRPGPDNPANIYIHAENGSFQIPLDAASKRVRVSFLFPGYEVAQLTIGTNEMAKEQTILMKPATDFKGRVLLPDGKPGIAAQVVFISATNQPRLGKHMFDCSMGQLAAVADMEGGFDHPQIADCQTVAAISESGFIQIPVEEFRKNPVLRLQPWGRVEGNLRIGDKMGAWQEVSLQPLNPFFQSSGLQFSSSVFRLETDAEGKFVFDFVPAGEFTLAKTFRASPTNSWSHYFLDTSYLASVLVTPGKTVVLSLGGEGARVTGRASLQAQAWDWGNTRLFASLELNLTNASPRGPINSASDLKAYMQSEDFKKVARARRFYALVVKENGTIEAPDIPPGTYQLTMEAKQNLVPRGEPVSPSRLKLLATLKKEIVIPEPTSGKPAVFDLGNLVLLPPGAE